jgi:hypothetical protein
MELTTPFNFAIKEINPPAKYRFSICTLVTNTEEYAQMVTSFIQAGFNQNECEFRYIDNSSENSFDAYTGLNLFLQNALGEYIILCHQDILLDFDNIDVLQKCIDEITTLDNNWAILSNAGGIENNLYQRAAINVAYPDGFYQRVGALPQKVISVDENFIVVKRSANLSLSADLTGFHLYGTDLCLIAELLGHTAYVVDFKLLHKSYGNPNDTYYVILQKLIDKYEKFMRRRRIVTTITDFYLSTSPFRKTMAETKWGKKIDRKITKLQRDKSAIRCVLDTKIYIYCPSGYATGGPECLYQLAHAMRKIGLDAVMYYYQTAESGVAPVHPNYEHFDIPYVTTIVDKKVNLIIVPETHLNPLFDKKYSHIRTMIWWLSVDNYLVVLNGLIDRKKDKPFFALKKALAHYAFPDLDFVKRSGTYNIVQSHYAQHFLESNGIKVTAYVNDYIGNTFLKQAAIANDTPRKDYVLYNPKKGAAFTEKLMQAAPHLQWKPLINLTPAQVAELLKESKVYVDFGEHPGRDRFPREAVTMGCCIITGMRGSAAFKEDVPIPDEFKFDENTASLQSILDKIETCLSNFEIEKLKFNDYRQIVLTDEERLISTTKKLFVR